MIESRQPNLRHPIPTNENDLLASPPMSYSQFCEFTRAEGQAGLEARAQRVKAARKAFRRYEREMERLGFYPLSQGQLVEMERDLETQFEAAHHPPDRELMSACYLMYLRDKLRSGASG